VDPTRVGILGGTFNPPHIAHLVAAAEARAQLGLTRVLLLPVAVPPHKEAERDPGAEERWELCRAAAAGVEWLEVSRLELDRGGPSYTVDTLTELHERSREDDLTFIVGGDMALDLPRWREPREVLRLARLGVAERAEVSSDRIVSALAGLGAEDRVDFFAMPRLDVSSSDVRDRVASGRPVRWLVPDAVAERIAARGLYT